MNKVKINQKVWAPQAKYRQELIDEAEKLILEWVDQGPEYELGGDIDYNGIRRVEIFKDKDFTYNAIISYASGTGMFPEGFIKITINGSVNEGATPERYMTGMQTIFYNSKNRLDILAVRMDLADTLEDCRDLETGDIRIHVGLCRLDGCDHVLKILKETPKSVYVSMKNSSKLYRLGKAELEAGGTSRESWCFSIYQEE